MNIEIFLDPLNRTEYLVLAAASCGRSLSADHFAMNQGHNGYKHNKPVHWIQYAARHGLDDGYIEDQGIREIERSFTRFKLLEKTGESEGHIGRPLFRLTPAGELVLSQYEEQCRNWQVLFETQDISKC